MDDIDKYSDFLFYNNGDGKINVKIIVDVEQYTIWTTQKGMSEIFEVEENTITYHLGNIYDTKELTRESTTRKIRVVRKEGKRSVSRNIDFYNLDAIISVGYRVNSSKATDFRKWATRILKEYMIKGFALDDERLKQGRNLFKTDFFKELLDRIREIRASERMFYEKITDIYRDCSADYDPNSQITKDFYSTVQNKLHYAICKRTGAEIIRDRADRSKINMGLTSYKAQKISGKITKRDVVIAKNYLSEDELMELNRLVSMFLDFAENMAKKRKIMYMNDWVKKLDSFLEFNEYPKLKGKGNISSISAKKYAINEFESFRIIQDRNYKSDFNRFVEKLSSGIIPLEDMINTLEETKEDSPNDDFDKGIDKILGFEED